MIVVPVHHTAQAYVDAYLTAAGIGEGHRGPLFRSCKPRIRDVHPSEFCAAGLRRGSSPRRREHAGGGEIGDNGRDSDNRIGLRPPPRSTDRGHLATARDGRRHTEAP